VNPTSGGSKILLGGVFEPTIEKEGGNAINTCRSKANLKYKKAAGIMNENVKRNIRNSRVIIQWHVIAVSSLGAFNKYSKEQLERILGTKVKKTITSGEND
jgi:hypothetical protein